MVLTNIHLNKNCRKCLLHDSFNCRESDVGESGNMYHRKLFFLREQTVQVNKLGWSRATLEITFGPLNLENKQNLGGCVGG